MTKAAVLLRKTSFRYDYLRSEQASVFLQDVGVTLQRVQSA